MVRLASGVVHKVPSDLREAIMNDSLEGVWNDLTPLMRNEWLCWVEGAK